MEICKRGGRERGEYEKKERKTEHVKKLKKINGRAK